MQQIQIESPAPAPAPANLQTSPEVFDRVIDTVANHPAKMLTLLVLANFPESELTRTQLFRETVRIQGLDPGWIQNGRTAGSYCVNSLAPIGAVITSKVLGERSKEVEAFQISEVGLQFGAPLAGALSQWELDHPENSLQLLLGSTTTANNTEDRMPSLRLELFSQLLTHPTGDISFSDLATAMNQPRSRMSPILATLRTEGIIEIQEKYDPAQRSLTLTRPDMTHVDTQTALRPETSAVYATVKELTNNQPEIVIQGDEFVAEVLKRNPDLDSLRVWKCLMLATTAKRLKCVVIKDFGDVELRHKQTKINLSEQYVAVVTDLVEIIELIRTSQAFRDAAALRGREIIENPLLAATLMKKAKQRSTNAAAVDLSVWSKQIQSVLPDAGADSRSLHTLVKESGNKISYVAFRNILTNLAVRNAVILDSIPDPSRNRRKQTYVRSSGQS